MKHSKILTMALFSAFLLGAVLFGSGTALASSGVMATPSTQTIYVDGRRVNMTVYSIGGNNYVKLRDIGEAVNFSVSYDAATRSVQIDSSASYREEEKTQTDQLSVPQPNPAAPEPSGQPYAISADHWSREDFSQAANPSVFTGIYDRALYNTLRQTITDLRAGGGRKCAYTMVSQADYSKVIRLVGRLDGVLRYEHYLSPNITNCYDYPDYFAVAAKMPENYEAPLACIQPVIAETDRMESDSEKVRYLNDYLCTRLDYKVGTTAGVARIFSGHEENITGACGSYAVAFSFLCSAADIPCVMVSSSNHTWNLVYADGQWLHVDAAANDAAGRNYILLSEINPNSGDLAPDATAFLKELLVPGSTK